MLMHTLTMRLTHITACLCFYNSLYNTLQLANSKTMQKNNHYVIYPDRKLPFKVKKNYSSNLSQYCN